ncbi:hypothetical protein ABPG74_015240 [Tetrahymena malaccensis]
MKKIEKIYQFVILHYLALRISVVSSSKLLQNQQVPYLYSDLYINKYDIKDPQSEFTDIKVAEKANLVFVSAGLEGIYVLDSLTNQIIFNQTSYSEFLYTIQATSDGEYVIFSKQNQFSLFKFSNRSSLQLLSQCDFPSVIINLLINSQENIVYAAGMSGELVAYDISNKYSVKVLAKYISQTSIIHQSYLSKDNKWILLANDVFGISVISVNDSSESGQLELVLAGQGILIWKAWAAIMVDDNQYIYGVDIYSGIYAYDFSIILSSDPSQYPIQLNFTYLWPNVIGYAFLLLQLSKDNKYLYAPVNSYGIFILDIQDRLNPILFQQISIDGSPTFLDFSPDGNYLYYSNSNSFFIFEQTTPNLNNNYPNLFNSHQSQLFDDGIDVYYRWRCYQKVIKQNQYMFQTLDDIGFNILQIDDPYHMNQIYQYDLTNNLNGIESLALSSDNRYLYVPVQDNNTSILVLDISDISNPTEAFRFRMPVLNLNEAIFFSKDYNYIVSSFDDGVLLIDSSQPPQLFLLDYWQMESNMIGENAGVMITNNNRYIISTIRGYGIYVLDALNKTSLQLKSIYYSAGAEGIIPSQQNDTYAFLFDGFKGVAILDLTVLPHIQFLSRFKFDGQVNFVQPILSDQYLIVSILDTSMIHLINIQDITNPFEMSQYQYQNQPSFSLCLSEDNGYAYILNNFGIVLLPLASQVIIHTQMQLITNLPNGVQIQQNIPNGQNLLVGQIIQFNFIILYPISGMIIQKIQYYYEQQIQDLPVWIQYSSQNQNLVLSVDKNSLDVNNLKAPNLNTILITIAIPLQVYSFQYNQTDLQLNNTEASLIFSYLKQQNIIDSLGYITDKFDHYEEFYFQIEGLDCSQPLFDSVKLTLQYSSFVNPVIFFVEQSLSLNIQDEQSPINSISNNIQLQLQVNSIGGKFVIQQFSGAIVQTNDLQNEIILQGQQININKILNQKIIFANYSSFDQISINVTLIDGVNYDYNEQFLLSDLKFIKQKLQIENNPQMSLQSQFNIVYPSGTINIEEEFSISFSSKSFISQDIQTISYQALLLKGDTYQTFNPDDWIQFESSSGSIYFHGNPPSSTFRDIYYIKVIATDGYTSTYDVFYINTSGLSFQFIANLMLKILPPIFAVLGLFKSRSVFFNIKFKEKVFFASEKSIIEEVTIKKIPILGDNMIKCRLLFTNFLIKSRDQNIENIKNEQQKQQVNLNQEQININRQKSYTNHSKKILQKTINNTRNTSFEKKYLQKDGSVRYSKILKDMVKQEVQFKLKKVRYNANNFISDFQNKNSLIFRGISALASRYLLRLDTKSYQVYKYLKYYSQKKLKHSSNNWYRAYVSIQSQDDISDSQKINPFPDCFLDEEQVQIVLLQLQVIKNKQQTFDSIADSGLNPHLIREVLFADALGLVDFSPSVFQPCIGESIHLYQYQIQSIEAFQKIESNYCMGIRRFLNIEYVKFGVHKNMQLPKWIEIENKNDVIILKYVPQSQDIGTILIKFFDIDSYVIKQYYLEVIDKKNKQLEFLLQDSNILYQTNQPNQMIPQNKKNLLQSFKNLHQSRKASQIKSQLKQNNLSSQVMSQQSEFQEKTILSNRSNLSQASSQNFSYINTNPVSPAQSQFKNTFLQFTNRLREFQSDLNVQREDLKLKQQNTKQDQALTTNIETDDILNTQINKEQNLDQSFNKIPHKFNLKQFK